jgi:hypothetical protein
MLYQCCLTSEMVSTSSWLPAIRGANQLWAGKVQTNFFPFSARLDTTSSNILISYEMMWYLTTFPFNLCGLFTVGYASDAEFKLKICCVLTCFLFQVTFFRLRSFLLISDYLAMIDYVL